MACKRQALGKGDRLRNVEFALFLHGVATGTINCTENVHDAGALHDHGVAGMNHNVANLSVSPPLGIVVRLRRRIAVGAFQLDYVAGKVVSPPVIPITSRRLCGVSNSTLPGFCTSPITVAVVVANCWTSMLTCGILENSLISECLFQSLFGLSNGIAANVNRLEESDVDIAVIVDAGRPGEIRLIVNDNIQKEPRSEFEACEVLGHTDQEPGVFGRLGAFLFSGCAGGSAGSIGWTACAKDAG